MRLDEDFPFASSTTPPCKRISIFLAALICIYIIPYMKSRTRVVVIGGGIGGLSTLYHLTQEGWSDVVLLEHHPNYLTSEIDNSIRQAYPILL